MGIQDKKNDRMNFFVLYRSFYNQLKAITMKSRVVDMKRSPAFDEDDLSLEGLILIDVDTNEINEFDHERRQDKLPLLVARAHSVLEFINRHDLLHDG